jgi:uncharacterized repeat protein (TIGR03803 family)
MWLSEGFCRVAAAAVGVAILAACGPANELRPQAASTGIAANRQRTTLPGEVALWSFTGGADGANPLGGVVADAAGNLYGAASDGGAHDYGTVFELTRSGSSYGERTLATLSKLSGIYPQGTLVLDSSGTIFGTAVEGGKYGYGTAFRLSTKGDGRERVIWDFGNGTDGREPFAGLVFGTNGVLYGTTQYGGLHGDGTVFKLTPSGREYIEQTLWSFGGYDGRYPTQSLMLGADGAIYGTTGGGGSGCETGCGLVFRLIPLGSSYSESILWNFRGNSDGAAPTSALTPASLGVLFGVTYFGGGTGCDGYGCGVAYELIPSGAAYSERVLWRFGQGTDGDYPDGNIVLGEHGRLFGTAQQGGTHLAGIFYELVPHGTHYIERVLWNFNPQSGGEEPTGMLITNAQRTVYGTASYGGTSRWFGTVYAFTP